ncbi:hypothetical protein AAF712_004659 [Marasmius tenuissimus]|uniref:Extracellular serine-rich protein n=1 Tax=Marasmius tenuissimus TaxID=585030 RepID=A0ABR3A4F1_9AGAR
MRTIPLELVLATFLSIVGPAAAQNIFSVSAGALGSFFVPDTISARTGDTVRFTFSKASHGVVQSSFDKPCVPLPGGFSSGVVNNNATTVSTWDLQITNETAIWFFCPLRVPVLHCTTGMVGAINPPSVSMVDDYKARSKLFNGSNPSASLALSGIGAVASAPPSASSTILDSTSTLSGSTTSSFSPKTNASVTPTSTSANTGSPHRTAATIGGAVAGAVALFAMIVIIIIFLRKRSQRESAPLRHETVETHYFPPPNPPPHSGKVESFTTAAGHTSPASYLTMRKEEGLPVVVMGYSNNPDQSSSSPHARGLSKEALDIRNQDSLGEPSQRVRPAPSDGRLRGHPHAATNLEVGAAEVDSGSSRRSETPPPDYESRGHGS